MASRKQPKSETSSTRKSTARKRVAQAPAASFAESSDDLERRIQDPDEPLSFLPEEHRSAAAQRRVSDQLVMLLNVLNEGSNYVNADVRPTLLTMINITSAMIATTRKPSIDPSLQAIAEEATHGFEREALNVIKTLAPDEVPSLPSTHFDLERKYNLTSTKLALLDAVDNALEGLVFASEREKDGKLDTRVLDQALVTEPLDDDVSERADNIALRILGDLITNLAFAKLLVRPAFPMRIVEDRRRLARVIGKLMEGGHATVVQVARAVLYVFGASAKSLKNTFSSKLLDEWETGWKDGTRRGDAPESA